MKTVCIFWNILEAFTDHVLAKYIETQLIMISHDILAQYWEPFGHISFFRRVNIDDLVTAEIGNSTTWE